MYYIYKIENKINYKVYIGQTQNPQSRKQNHFRELNGNRHSNPYLQEDYNQYGSNNFEFIILDYCDTYEESLSLENHYMDLYGGTNNSSIYNVRGNGHNKSNLEYRVLLNSNLNPRAFVNHTHSIESKLKIGDSLKDAYASGRREKKCLKGKDNPFYGKQHSEETKKLISEKHTNNRKYSSDFIDILINEYNQGSTYVDLCEKYKISKYVLPILIKHKDDYLKYGSGKRYKQRTKKCND